MVIGNRNFRRAFRRPLEQNAPLVVDADGVKAGQVAAQLFQLIAGRDRQVAQTARLIELNQFANRHAQNRRVSPAGLRMEKFLGIFVGK